MIIDKFREFYKSVGYVLVPQDLEQPMHLVKYDDNMEDYIGRAIIDECDIKPDFVIELSSVPSKNKRYYVGNGKWVSLTREDNVHDVGADDPTNPTLQYSTFKIEYYAEDRDECGHIPFYATIKISAIIEKHDAPDGMVSGIVIPLWMLRKGCACEIKIFSKDS